MVVQYTTQHLDCLIFDPQFFTKILLDEDIIADGRFASGKYVYGLESGAYGVVEGPSDGKFTTNKTLMVKTLFGNFKSGETIRDEDNFSVRAAKDNTISHFIVNNRGSNYVDGSKLRIDGVEFDSSKVELNIQSGAIVAASVANRELFNEEYSRPPIIDNTRFWWWKSNICCNYTCVGQKFGSYLYATKCQIILL